MPFKPKKLKRFFKRFSLREKFRMDRRAASDDRVDPPEIFSSVCYGGWNPTETAIACCPDAEQLDSVRKLRGSRPIIRMADTSVW
jgi:hypothetical protein